MGFRLTGSCLEQRDPRLDLQGSFFTGEIKGAQNLRRPSAPGPPKSVPAPSWTEDPRPRRCFSSSQLQCHRLCALCVCGSSYFLSRRRLLPELWATAEPPVGTFLAMNGLGSHEHWDLLPACSGTHPTAPSRRCDIRGVSSRQL